MCHRYIVLGKFNLYNSVVVVNFNVGEAAVLVTKTVVLCSQALAAF